MIWETLMALANTAWIVSMSLLLGAGPNEPDAKTVRAAVEKALPLLGKGAEGHVAQRTCFACHNQTLPVLTFSIAREKGLTAPAFDTSKQNKFIAAFLDQNRDNYRKGRGQGGQVDMAGYALLTLEWGNWKPDATTDAVVEYLLLYNKDIDHWRVTANRPPSEVSDFTANYVALRGLRKWGRETHRERIDRRIDTVRGWLLKTRAKDTEDRVFRLLALKEAGANETAIKAATQELINSQRKDGGWSQFEKTDSDAYATGSALFALHRAGGLATTDAVYQRGLAFLIGTQLPDGSWRVQSRSRPFQTYYESGFPHGKNQFISMAGSGWAAAALVLACPPVQSVP
jgi:hypothetical protein